LLNAANLLPTKPFWHIQQYLKPKKTFDLPAPLLPLQLPPVKPNVTAAEIIEYIA